uniref:Uncharacterized protein n=2 Tax=Caenorhabditis japonica TaxID=281687 RepID=A0A8R1DNN9_CAEJA
MFPSRDPVLKKTIHFQMSEKTIRIIHPFLVDYIALKIQFFNLSCHHACLDFHSVLWNTEKKIFSVHFVCNKCGKFSQKCCGPIVKFVRTGVFTQLTAIVDFYLDRIISIRRKLRAGDEIDHPLASPFLKPLWQAEKEEHSLLLSGVLSIDGVSVAGNTKKLWPVSLILVDLPVAEMQRSSNVLLEGIAECVENPSTQFWNSIQPLILSDLQSPRGVLSTCNFKLRCVTLTADQPFLLFDNIDILKAKRSFFGLRSHQSAKSCCYCLSDGTFYKKDGPNRHDVRNGNLTVEDSRQGVNGFGPTASNAIHVILPYECPIDLLHNLGEGAFELIRKELFHPHPNFEPRSAMFKTNAFLEQVVSEVVVPSSFGDLRQCRNGSDKIHFFRIKLGLAAINSDSFSLKGRLVVIALSLLTNKMFSNSKCSPLFDTQLCASSRWYLAEASEKYLVTKVHETLYHLPHINKLYGNVAPLSTFCFESSYQFALMGYSTRMTRNFPETVCSRVLLHNSIRKELRRRADGTPSPGLKRFLALTPGIVPQKMDFKNVINNLDPEDEIDNYSRFPHYSILNLSMGKLKSRYNDFNTCDDFFFARGENDDANFYRFIAAIPQNGSVRVLAEPVVELDRNTQFSSLKESVQSLDGTDLYYGCEVVKFLELYEGLKRGRLAGSRVILDPINIVSQAAYLCLNDYSFVLLAAVHAELNRLGRNYPINTVMQEDLTLQQSATTAKQLIYSKT